MPSVNNTIENLGNHFSPSFLVRFHSMEKAPIPEANSKWSRTKCLHVHVFCAPGQGFTAADKETKGVSVLKCEKGESLLTVLNKLN